MPTFDVVSQTDLAEVDNALNGMGREIAQRFDFKGSDCVIEREGEALTILADDDLKLRQMQELLRVHLTRRGVEIGALDYQSPEKAAGNKVRQRVTIRQGISGGPWLQQGLRFGIAIALFAPIPTYLTYYAVQEMTSQLVVSQIVGDSVLVVLLGILVAFLHREPSVAPAAE